MKNISFLLLCLSLFTFTGCAAGLKVAMVNPGAGVGGVHLGMTASQVRGVLGEPRLQKPVAEGMSYTYPSEGINIMVHYPEMTVRRIDAGSGFKEGQWLREFWGKTSEGLEIGSTKDEVARAYGPPDPPPTTRSRSVSQDEIMVYRRRGISFLFSNQRVVRMSVFPASAK